MGCFHNLHLKKPSKPFFASLQLAVNVPVALCGADFFKAVFILQNFQTCSGDHCYGDELAQQLLQFSPYLYLEERRGEQVWAEREGRSALSAYVPVWMFMCDSS